MNSIFVLIKYKLILLLTGTYIRMRSIYLDPFATSRRSFTIEKLERKSRF